MESIFNNDTIKKFITQVIMPMIYRTSCVSKISPIYI